MRILFSCLLWMSVQLVFAQQKPKSTTMPKGQSTTELQYKNPPELFDPRPYGFNHSIAVDTPYKVCYISGQSGGVGTSHTLAPDFKTQVQDALTNLETVLKANNMSFDNVVKITLLIVDHDQDKLDIWTAEAKKKWKNASFPTSTLIPVSKLALPNMLFEIDAIAIQKI